MQGESRRLEALGYRMSGNACYILCSLECRRFYETEVEPPTDAGDAPHQRQIVQPYISAEKETGNENASTSSSSSVGKGAVADAAAGVGDKGDVSDDKLSDEYGAPLMSNLDHALNNCALEDIRDRLGFARATPPALLPSAVVAPPTDSTATSTAAAAAAITTTTTAAASTSGDLSTTANASSNGITAFATVPTASITPVLSNVNSRLKVRFTCLGEIPNFHLRLEKAGPRVKSLLFKLINDIMLYQQRLMDKAKEKEGAKADTAAGAAEKPPAAAAAAADEAEESDEESVNMERVKKDAYNHKGVHPSLAAEDIGRVFLHTVGTIARAQKFELFPLAEALGLGFVSPIIRNLNNKPSSDSEVANNIARFLLEPKFRYLNPLIILYLCSHIPNEFGLVFRTISCLVHRAILFILCIANLFSTDPFVVCCVLYVL